MLGARQKGITDLVDNHFVGGAVYQSVLHTQYYHRWHAPISGKLIKSYHLDGGYFVTNPIENQKE